MTGTAARAIAASTSIDGWPQHAGPWLPSRKPRWSRKCTFVVRSWRFTLAITVRTGEQYCNHKQSVRITPHITSNGRLRCELTASDMGPHARKTCSCGP